MSFSARRYTNFKEQQLNDKALDLIAEETGKVENHEGVRIFCIVGDIWEAACAVFPSLTWPDREDGAWKDDQGIWHTYSSDRQVDPKGRPGPWICFGEEGSLNAASEVAAYMQSHNCKGWIEFVDGYRIDVHDYQVPEWAQKGTYYRHMCGHGSWHDDRDTEGLIDKEFRCWLDDLYEEHEELVKSQMENNYRYIGDSYYESLDPNDYLFYTEDMIENLIKEKVQSPYSDKQLHEQKLAQLREQLTPVSPYANVFAKALKP